VLHRTEAQSAALRHAFDRPGIPSKKSTPAPIAGVPAVRALLARLGVEDEAARRADRLAAAAARLRASDADIDAVSLADATRWLTAHADGARTQSGSANSSPFPLRRISSTPAPSAFRC
jgi:hypothetical protein